MSRTLGVSRAAVWKAIEALRQEGYEITSAPTGATAWSPPPDRVREGSCPATWPAVWWGAACSVWTPSTPPTREAKRQAMAGAPEGLVVLAEEQTGGRGRLGRSFQSPGAAGCI